MDKRLLLHLFENSSMILVGLIDMSESKCYKSTDDRGGSKTFCLS